MVASYHDVHYQTFHLALPQIVLTDAFEHFLNAVLDHQLPKMLVKIWNHVAKTLSDGSQAHADLLVIPQDFQVVIDEPDPDWTTVLVITPPVRAGLEAIMIAVLFDDEFKHKPMYFTCEAPATPESPYMIGQLTNVGQRSNLGPIFEVSVESMLSFVARQVP